MAWIELKPEGGGTQSEPGAPIRADAPRGGVVVVQEIFGVNAHIRAVTDNFAAEGYLAVAPAIFEHIEKGFDVGYDPESRARGMAIMGKVDCEQMLRDVAAAVEVAKEGGKVAVVGFCLGGTVAWGAAAQLSGLSAAVGYYGGGIIGAEGPEAAHADALAFRREGPAHPHRRGKRGRRRPPGGRGPYLSRRPRLQLRPPRELRRAERGARLDAHDSVPPQAPGVSDGADSSELRP